MSEQSKPRSVSNQLAVDQPVQDADRNQNLARSSDSASKNVFLPSLDSGLTLLDVNSSRGVPILQSIVLDRLLMSDGPAFWVDARGHATTASMAQLSPSQRLLGRIHVARGFTAYQHFGALCDLPTAVNRSIQQSAVADPLVAGRLKERRKRPGHEQESSPHTPALIAAPALDAMYRTGAPQRRPRGDTPGTGARSSSRLRRSIRRPCSSSPGRATTSSRRRSRPSRTGTTRALVMAPNRRSQHSTPASARPP